ncbi:MAG TPA: exodeoxyribonuclease VII large subunit [Patescibacteria group bacterium]|nr:exodeoxyribonuclease VII large subunit [Patescibacteria group bacterium]
MLSLLATGMNSNEIVLGVSDFVALLNQTLEYAYPNVTITGELANFKVSKNRWVYFDLKDETATVHFFGTVYQLPGPLEDGMVLAVKGLPRLHAQFGFSVNVMNIRPVGEGSIKKAAALLQAKLTAEGLFDPERKRSLPYPPARIGLITSGESAAYRDFVKVLAARWGGVEIILIDVQVQGESAPAQLSSAIKQANQLADPPEVLVITRGGGSADDLQAFSTEQVTRAVAASRIPTLVAIGHEIDTSLAELAADQRASTPSNAAELLVPDKQAEGARLHGYRVHMGQMALGVLQQLADSVGRKQSDLRILAERVRLQAEQKLQAGRRLLEAYNPQTALLRGYALVRADTNLVSKGAKLQIGEDINIQFSDSDVTAEVKKVMIKDKTK